MNSISDQLARMDRRFYRLVAIFLLTGGIAFCLLFVTYQRHREFCDNVKVDLLSLAKKRPSNVTKKQWENIVAWTLNAHANCLAFQIYMPREEMIRFEAMLKQKLSELVSLETIDWIWDEFVRLTSNGERYSDSYRPTLPTRLKEFEEGNYRWGIEVN